MILLIRVDVFQRIFDQCLYYMLWLGVDANLEIGQGWFLSTVDLGSRWGVLLRSC